MALSSVKKFVLLNSTLALLGSMMAADHGLQLWKHFQRTETLGAGRLALEAAMTGLMSGVVAIALGRLAAFWRSRRGGGE